MLWQTLTKESRMPKGYENYKNDRKKPKFTLKEKRALKREKKLREHQQFIPEQNPEVPFG